MALDSHDSERHGGRVPSGFVGRQIGKSNVVIRADLADISEAELWQSGSGLAEAAGRGEGVTTFELCGCGGPVQVVARDFRRGGVLGSVFGARYLDGDRASSELVALERLRQRDLPVVEPIAALSLRRGIAYRLRLLTVRVEGAVPLPAFVAQHPELRRELVREAGRVVAIAFDLGLLHRDLHADNLIARRVGSATRTVEVRLLDLDRARIRNPLSDADREGMLLRMARYLQRHASRVRARRVDTVRFFAGFGLSRADRRSVIERLTPPFDRMLARHGIPAVDVSTTLAEKVRRVGEVSRRDEG